MTYIDEFGEIEIRPDEMEEEETRTGDHRHWTRNDGSLIRLGRHTLIDDELEIVIVKETEKAIQVQITEIVEGEEDYTVEHWVPRSVFTATEFGLEVQPWFVKKNHLGKYAAKITRYTRET